ncbi:MAG: hypothetical protein GF330_05825 [Candidatus Eisenbacteria bacterium]|nr:hypothetical protein [Candidatus Eisenbacteria bacterium]
MGADEVHGRFGMRAFLQTALLLLALTTLASGQEPFEGQTLIAPMNATYTELIDLDGTVLHTWHGASRPASMAYLLDDGSVLRPCVDPGGYFSGGGTGGRIQRIDPDDQVVWDYFFSTDDYQQHHDVEPLPNGNVLVVAWEHKSREEALGAGRQQVFGEMWPTLIVEIEPLGASGGTIVWAWHAWDHLIQDVDPQKPNYGVVSEHPERFDINYGQIPPETGDWLHINAIDYDPIRDQIVFSSRPFGEIYVIDHSTTTEEAAGHQGGNCGMGGDILYRWGNPQTYDRGLPDDQYFFAPHGVNWIDAGMPGSRNLLIFNNGDRPGGADDYTTVDELVTPQNPDGTYEIAPGEPFGPSAPTWTYGGPETYGGPTQCGAYRLPNGNTLITYCEPGHIFEVSETGATVWEHNLPGQTRVARAPRYWEDTSSAPASADHRCVPDLDLQIVSGHPLVDRIAFRVRTANGPSASLAVHDLLGRRVRTLRLECSAPGEARAVWNGRDSSGRDVPAGAYFTLLHSGRVTKTMRLCVVR